MSKNLFFFYFIFTSLIFCIKTHNYIFFYLLGTTAILSVFAFLFLIPFVVDPAISTIVADYDPVPVTCTTTDHVYATSLTNCSWASCREGCTSTPVKCHQILVNYSRIPFFEWKMTSPKELELVEWDVMDTRLLINTEGCGYPPKVNCTIFAREYGWVVNDFYCNLYLIHFLFRLFGTL